MENFKQKFIDTAYTKFGVKANGSINFEQAFEIIDEIEQCNIANVEGQSEQLVCKCGLSKDKKSGVFSCMRTDCDMPIAN